MQKKSTLLIIVLLFVNLLSILSVIQNYREKNKNENTYMLNYFTTKINTILEDIFFSIELTETIVKLGYKDMSIDKLNMFMSPISKQNTVINIAILPAGIVEYIFPLEGNEKAIGDNIFKMPNRKLEAKIALETRETIICGPYKLTQGGEGIIARKAIYSLNSRGFQEFWGMVAVVLDSSMLLKQIDLKSLKYSGYEYELSASVNGLKKNEIEKTENFDKNKANFRIINLSNGYWKLGIQNPIKIYQLFNIFLIFIFEIFISILLYKYIHKKEVEIDFIKNEIYLDNLTGLYNRKILEELKNNLINYSVFYIDLNDFKSINDTYGHDIGDKLLIEISKRIKSSIRKKDFAIRIGGDEFVVVLLESNNNLIKKFLQRIQEIQKCNFIYNNLNIKFSLSYGYASFTLDGNNMNELLKLADSRMYLNKKKHKLKKI